MAGMHTSEEHVQLLLVHWAQTPLRQILCDAQLLGGPHEGAQVHVVPSGRHTLVVPELHESCSDELQAHATAITMNPARARAHLTVSTAGTTGAMLPEVRRCMAKVCPDSLRPACMWRSRDPWQRGSRRQSSASPRARRSPIRPR